MVPRLGRRTESNTGEEEEGEEEEENEAIENESHDYGRMDLDIFQQENQIIIIKKLKAILIYKVTDTVFAFFFFIIINIFAPYFYL